MKIVNNLFLKFNTKWLLAGVLMTLASSFGQTYFISIFAAEICKEFRLSHGVWGGIYTLGTGVSAIVLVWIGVLVHIYRARVMATISILGLSLSCIGMGVNQSVWLLPIVIFALRFTGQGMLMHIPGVSMARWFNESRGKAIAISKLGYAIGYAFLPMIFVTFMNYHPWRFLWIVVSVIVVMFIPAILFLLKNEKSPKATAINKTSKGMLEKNWTRKETLCNRLFWMISPSIIFPSMFNTALFFQQVHFVNIKGWSHVMFVSTLPAYTLTTIISMIVAGWAIDRWGSGGLMSYYLLPFAGGFMILWMAGSILQALIGIILIALTSGINTALSSTFWAEYYGTRYLGEVKSISSAMMVIGSAIGPGLSGLLIDLKFDFTKQILGIVILTIFSTITNIYALKRAKLLLMRKT